MSILIFQKSLYNIALVIRKAYSNSPEVTMKVMTVAGPIDPEELGITMTHEHTIADLRHWGYDGVLDDVDLAIDELKKYKNVGGNSIVDVTNACMGRDVKSLRKISQNTGLHLIAATGYYTEPYYPDEVYQLGTNALADVMIAELDIGIDNTDIKAGIIGEIGTIRDYIKPAEERVFRAAARAHHQTAAPITTHTYLDQLVHDQLDILEEEGVDLTKVIIGHLGDKRDIEFLLSVAERGPFVQIDHVGLEDRQRDHARSLLVQQLLTAGHLEKILISMDVCFKSRLHWFGGTGYDHLITSFLPQLKKQGLSDADIQTIIVENPARSLAF